jgi:hypothetical protein
VVREAAECDEETITLQSGPLRVDVVPAKGAEIRLVALAGEDNVLFHEPWATPMPAGRGPGYGDSMLDWLAGYRGGWQELFPNAGAACTVLGVELPFHGETSSAPWQLVEASGEQVTVRCNGRLPLIIERTMRISSTEPVLYLRESVRTDSRVAKPTPYCWGHHPAFDAPPGSVVDLPSSRLWTDEHSFEHADYLPGIAGDWPFVPPKTPGGGLLDLSVVPDGPVERLCYLRPSEGWAAIRNVPAGYGVGLAWKLETFPFLWFWQQIGGSGFPWYGRGRITAIEPNTSWPADGLAGALARGHAHVIRPGELHEAWLTLVVFRPAEHRVARIGQDGLVELAEQS